MSMFFGSFKDMRILDILLYRMQVKVCYCVVVGSKNVWKFFETLRRRLLQGHRVSQINSEFHGKRNGCTDQYLTTWCSL